MLTALAIVVLTPSGWTDLPSATHVQVLRGTTAPFVAISEVQPTERVIACDVEIVENKCPGTAPGRPDDWWLFSDLVATPEPLRSVTASWQGVDQDTEGEALTGVTYTLYWGPQGAETPIQREIITTSAVVTAPLGRPYCGWVVAVAGGIVSDDSPHACITLTETRKPRAPTTLELKATLQ